MKLADISGTKRKEYLKAKIDELENNSKIKNIRDLYRGINVCKKGYQPRTDIEKDDLATDCAVFWVGAGTISLSCSMYIRLMKLGRQQYAQQNHQCLSQVTRRFSWLLKC